MYLKAQGWGATERTMINCCCWLWLIHVIKWLKVASWPLVATVHLVINIYVLIRLYGSRGHQLSSFCVYWRSFETLAVDLQTYNKMTAHHRGANPASFEAIRRSQDNLKKKNTVVIYHTDRSHNRAKQMISSLGFEEDKPQVVNHTGQTDQNATIVMHSYQAFLFHDFHHLPSYHVWVCVGQI